MKTRHYCQPCKSGFELLLAIGLPGRTLPSNHPANGHTGTCHGCGENSVVYACQLDEPKLDGGQPI